MSDVFDIILLLALPASGKSETRKFLTTFDEKTIRDTFHFGTPFAQLDDFPYVHMMRRIDEELKKAGGEFIFFQAADKSFVEPETWGVLTLLLSEDYETRIEKGLPGESSVVELLKRIDEARSQLGVKRHFYKDNQPLMSQERIDLLTKTLQKEFEEMQEERRKEIPENLRGSTLIIEFARGGADGATMPLPHGYGYNLSLLSPQILKKAAILYVWVTPEESRRKNFEREDPNDPGSILAHCVPLEVMLKEYGCDDIDYLVSTSDKDGFIKIERPDGAYYLPIERLDNRDDKTSFVRDKTWKEEDKTILYNGLKESLSKLHGKYKSHLNRV